MLLCASAHDRKPSRPELSPVAVCSSDHRPRTAGSSRGPYVFRLLFVKEHTLTAIPYYTARGAPRQLPTRTPHALPANGLGRRVGHLFAARFPQPTRFPSFCQGSMRFSFSPPAKHPPRQRPWPPSGPPRPPLRHFEGPCSGIPRLRRTRMSRTITLECDGPSAAIDRMNSQAQRRTKQREAELQ